MAVLLHAAKDLVDHFWGRLPYYNYKQHSGADSHPLPLNRTNNNNFVELEVEADNNLDAIRNQEEESASSSSSLIMPNENSPTKSGGSKKNLLVDEKRDGERRREDELKVRVFTLNAGLIAITPHYKDRMSGIISYLNTSSHDVVCLQEICFQWIAIEIIQKVKQRFPFSYFFNFGIGFPLWPGCDGTGLLLLSKFRILETFYDKFHVNGYPWALQHCDYLGSKGISFARLELPPQFSPSYSSSSSAAAASTSSSNIHATSFEPAIMTLYATHLHAEYNDNYKDRANGSQDEYHAHRVAQGLQMAQFARLTAENDPHHLHVMCGDFNAPPTSPIVALQNLAGFTDVMDDELANAEPRATFGCKANWFHTHGKTLPQRVDFILYRTSADTAEKRQLLPWRAIEAKTVCANIPNSSISLSDHNGVAATFLYDAAKSSSSNNSSVYGSGGGRRGSTSGNSGIMRRRQPNKQLVPLLKQADEMLQHGIDVGLRRRNRHRNFGLALWFFAIVLLLSTRVQWTVGIAIVFFFLGLAELLICHYVFKDEIKVFQEKASQVHLFLETIR